MGNTNYDWEKPVPILKTKEEIKNAFDNLKALVDYFLDKEKLDESDLNILWNNDSLASIFRTFNNIDNLKTYNFGDVLKTINKLEEHWIEISNFEVNVFKLIKKFIKDIPELENIIKKESIIYLNRKLQLENNLKNDDYWGKFIEENLDILNIN